MATFPDDATRGAPGFADPDQGSQQRTGRSVSAMVPTVPNPSESRVTPGFLLLSSRAGPKLGGYLIIYSRVDVNIMVIFLAADTCALGEKKLFASGCRRRKDLVAIAPLKSEWPAFRLFTSLPRSPGSLISGEVDRAATFSRTPCQALSFALNSGAQAQSSDALSCLVG